MADDWIDIGAAAEILGRSRATARRAAQKAGLEHRVVMAPHTSGGASRAFLLRRVDVEKLAEERQAQRQARRDRERRRDERQRETAKRDQVARSQLTISPGSGRRKRRPPPDAIDRRVAQLAPIPAVRQLPELAGATPCAADEPGAVALGANRWVRKAGAL